MNYLKKKNNFCLNFIRVDKIFFNFVNPYYIISTKINKFILWRTSAKHFLWSLRKFSSTELSLSKKFFIKFF